MATNTYKKLESGTSRSIFSVFERLIGKDSSLNEGISVKVIPIASFLLAMLLIYIGITHSAERMIRRYDVLKQEVDDLRSDYTTLKADYMYSSKQSEVARKVVKMDLVESKQPPYKLKVKED